MPESPAPSVATCLWFQTDPEPAAEFYAGLLPGSSWSVPNREMLPDGSLGAAFMAEVVLQGQRLILMNGGPQFKLTPAASIQVHVETQAEIDRLWSALLEGGSENRCGWLTDRWGVSWQIIPRALPRLLALPDRAAAGRAMQAMMGMVKLDIAALEAAAAQKV
ncbi:VOC family protein [Frigidibacter sp. ROC022]|uniref:VOC family protein n=1 Tax=Frigidibacter sp. ROC022 TaxID=2971796 RepID=UPI00215B4976|nr:VOC family protein [Frigidibacter sp. ROC022]MCR8723420.1 VOC family protein [Frigidibacter sp. ROC022]